MRIVFITGSTADYGLLRPVIRAAHRDPRLEPNLVVCGRHDLGRIQVDGFAVDAVVPLDLDGDRPADVAVAAGRTLAGLAGPLSELSPDMILLLGDRYEIMAAAVAATLMRIPIVHLFGGDITRGSLDDPMRDAITRLAHLHLPASETAARRLIALSEPADRIHVVGDPSLDDLIRFVPLPRDELERMLGLSLEHPTVLVAYHAATLAAEDPEATMQAVLEGVAAGAPGASVVITRANADEGGRRIDAVAGRAASARDNWVTVPPLGQEGFWSLLHRADLLVGNSSAGLREAPITGIPVVDVGRRQEDRLRAPSTLHADATTRDVADAVRAGLASGRRPGPSPYGDGRAAERVVEIVAGVRDPRALLRHP